MKYEKGSLRYVLREGNYQKGKGNVNKKQTKQRSFLVKHLYSFILALLLHLLRVFVKYFNVLVIKCTKLCLVVLIFCLPEM